MLNPGTKVMGQWSNGQWYPGTVTQSKGEHVFVQFDDGDTAWLSPAQVRGMEAPKGGVALTVGTRVSGMWSNGQWYPGIIGQAKGEHVFVQFDDGDSAWLSPAQVRPLGGAAVAPVKVAGPGISPSAGPPPAIGARVSGQWSNGSWYPGAITQSNGALFFVQFDDGDSAWLAPEQIRVLSAPPAPQHAPPPQHTPAPQHAPPPQHAAPPQAAPQHAAPPAAPQPPAVQVVERQVVERQVLVIRCPFCKQITPADMTKCRECGANVV